MLGLEYIDTNSGHEKWGKEGLRRPVVFQTHVNPVPEFVIRNAISDMEISRQEFLAVLENL